MFKLKIPSVLFIILLLLPIVLPFTTEGCKDIAACGDATAGDYNLFLKVRDPSRPGLQVLYIIPEGYEYTYHYPWTGKSMSSSVEHKYIVVASKDDVIPNIVKAGMALTDAGLAFGDADSVSGWANPTKNAWDDFDWLRYAYEVADSEEEAVSLLTENAVDEMHATGVTENLFVVGPDKGYMIEADAFRYNIKEIDDGVVVISNYPKELWKTQFLRTLPIASSFDIEKERIVRKGRTVRLNSLFGVRIIDIGENCITAKQVPFFKNFKQVDGKLKLFGNTVNIKLGERKTVGDYSVELLDVNSKKAKIRVCYKFKAWEDELMGHINSKYGSITAKDMINWSRLGRDDLDGLRPMCEDIYEYEAAAIYKIPSENYEVLSGGWFSASLACSSIYVPFHICDNDIFDPYETGEAAELSLELFNTYGEDNLACFSKAEDVFFYENDVLEEIATERIEEGENISEFLTIFDTSAQKQAWFTEQIWMDASKISNQKEKQETVAIISNIWEKNYSSSLKAMEFAIYDLEDITGTATVSNMIKNIALSVCKSRIDEATAIGKSSPEAKEEYEKGKQFIDRGEYELGFGHLQTAYTYSDRSMKGLSHADINNKEFDGKEEMVILPYVLIVLLIAAVIVLFLKRRAE